MMISRRWIAVGVMCLVASTFAGACGDDTAPPRNDAGPFDGSGEQVTDLPPPVDGPPALDLFPDPELGGPPGVQPLAERLKEAKAGTTVTVNVLQGGAGGSVVLTAPLVIKAGVTLVNTGTGEFTIEAPARGGCFRVETDAEVPFPSVIKGLGCKVTRGAGLIV
ncbi:MAG: hypothetical protein KAI47_19355, partial [Deltaproteobacteria bacterium]|nr:hypothetical protein [Deltaproteobacteria bacterium]